MEKAPILSWPDVAGFVRQHAHDVRNHLNSLDLEAALLDEILADPEGKECIARLRGQIRRSAAELRELSARFSEPKPSLSEQPAREIFLIWQDQLAAIERAPAVAWKETLGEARIRVDPVAIGEVFRELFVNTRDHAPGAELDASAAAQRGEAIYELRERQDRVLAPEEWTDHPFHSTRRGGYGLGLFHAQRLVVAQGGSWSQQFKSTTKELVTRIALPVI